MRRPSASSLVKLALLLALIAGAVWIAFFTETGRQFRAESIREHAQSIREYLNTFPPWLLPLLYIGFYVLGTLLLLPGLALSFIGALLFGLFEATVYTWFGATVGAVLAFLLAKFLGRDFVNQLLGGRLQALDERLTRHGFMGLLILRLVPLFPFNGINFGSGLTGIRLRDYVLATALGILPGTLVYQFLFARLGDKVLSGGWSFQDLNDPWLLAALGLFIAFILAGKLLSSRLQGKPPMSPPTS